MEEKVLARWEKHRVFEKTLKARQGKKQFVFYEGPPTANGMPHPGHVMGRCFKDLVLRYKTMRGYFVPRRAGWDTHGLPVEIGVEKQLGLKSKADIEKMGVAQFNRLCRESVWKYKDEWEKMTRRIGFWLDMGHPYITYENDYIETLWWVIARIFKKGLLAEDFKVVPYCARCGTGLSSHEVAQGYKTVKENSLYVKFRLKKIKPKERVFNEKLRTGTVFDDERAPPDATEYFLVWTTTPWTLPANVALAVHPDLDYVRAQKGAEVLIVAKSRVEDVLPEGWKMLETLKGRDLAGLEYEQLFSFLTPDKKAFFVVGAEFVSAQDGSGIVHIAPAYGEDDMAAAKAHNLPILHPVKENGEFSDALPWKGMFVKRADKAIVEELNTRGALFKEEQYEHEYPFCWRCGTPLLYFARKSWFIKMSGLKEKLLLNNQTVNWVPGHLKEGRFGEWLKDVKDWAFSRDRFWGTPLPVWRCAECGHTETVQSVAELGLKSKFSNRYFIMRHGEAESNIKDVCDSLGDKSHLTEHGKAQIAQSLQKFAKAYPNDGVDLIICSPFARTRETAAIAGEQWGLAPSAIVTDPLLREINVGMFDGRKVSEYGRYFSFPEEQFTKTPPRGENLNDVKKRVARFMRETEAAHAGKTILIVSHEDSLWILESMYAGRTDAQAVRAKQKKRGEHINAKREKRGEYIKTGELRALACGKLPLDDNGGLDLHKPFIDEIIFSCEHCRGVMRRVPEVTDVWFDSGAMPFAQTHWPFAQIKSSKLKVQNIGQGDYKKLVKHIPFPADFICEGVDQTRGWFYTLLAVSTVLGLETPYRNVLSLGHILDKHGKKMSKSKKNYTDPMDIADRLGIDALRWYFFVVNPAGEPKRFDEKDVVDAQRKSVMALLNVLQFLSAYTNMRRRVSRPPEDPLNILDRWILSRLSGTTATVTDALDRYDALSAVRALADFLDDLTNWYVRRSRERFQLRGHKEDSRSGEATLRHVFETTLKLLAPFLPFVTDHIWGKLGKSGSVHQENYPASHTARIDTQLEYDMIQARNIASIALAKRAQAKIKVRQPLPALVIKEPLRPELKEIIREEVNVKEVEEDATLEEAIRLDTALTPELKEEGMVRDIIRQVQQARKDMGLTNQDRIEMKYHTDERTASVVEKWSAHIMSRVGGRKISQVDPTAMKKAKEIILEDVLLKVAIKKLT